MLVTRNFVLALLLLLPTTIATAADNSILNHLIEVGVPVGTGAPLKLPQPTMPDGLDAAGQKAALKSIADTNHPVTALVHKNVNAPFQVKTQTEANAAGERTGRRIDLYFVVYGDLDEITKEGFFQEHFALGADKKKPETKTGDLPEAALKKRGLTSKKDDTYRETYAFSQFGILERVQVSGTGHIGETKTKESVLLASILDPKFIDDPEYPNQWRSIKQDPAGGKDKLGDPNPYSGYGAYVKITRLQEPPDALFIEFHLVFDEPQGWFNGANLLGSKVPTIASDSIRDFRRELMKMKK